MRIGFTDASQAKGELYQKIFYERYRKTADFGGKSKPCSMSCLQEGHMSNHFTSKMMFPYCVEAHQVDMCLIESTMTSNWTACARAHKITQPDLELKTIFSKTPLNLRHSLLDPICPARLATKKSEAAKAALTAAKQVAGTTGHQ